MATLQIKDNSTTSDVPPTTSDMKLCELFQTVGYNGNSYYMRVNMAKEMLTSSIVKSYISRGYVPVVDLGNGLFNYIKGDILVTRVESAELNVK